MSFDLSQLRFQVNTEELDEAVKKVGQLATAVVALNKPLSKLGAESKNTTKDIDTTTKAVENTTTVVKKSQTVLERQESILKFMSDGYSKGQSSILAMGKATGLVDTELQKLGDTIDRQRKLQGSEPFDRSIGAIKVLKNELGALREAYRQTIKAEQSTAGGESFAALTTKQSKDLYREKFRLIEQFKDQTNTELTTYAQLKTQLRSLNTEYLAAAKSRNTLAGVDTIQQTKRRDQLQYLARATSVQLGDIGVSLAGGQNPLTVLIQQADQMRGIFAQVGASGEEMKAGLSSAFKQIVVGFKDVVLVLGQFVLGAFVDTGKAIAKFATDITYITPALDFLRAKLAATAGETSAIVKAFDKAGSIIGAATAVGIGAGILALAGLVFAYKEVISTSHDLSVALSTNGAAIAITKSEALALSSALANGSGSTMDFAKAITEITKAGNLSKESIAGIATVALDLQKYAGIAVKDTVAGYSKLADDPVKALNELGAATGRVTLAQIDEVKGLVEIGKQYEAVALAIKFKQESDSQAVAIQKSELSEIERLFHEVKEAIKLVKEEFYSVIQNGANIGALTTAWQTVVVVVSEVWFTLKAVGKEIGGIAAQIGALGLGDFEGAKRIGDMMKSDAEAARTAQDKFTQSIINGTQAKKGQLEIDTKGNALVRESIEANKRQDALKSKFGANSKLTADVRKKELDNTIAQIRANAEIIKSAKGVNKSDIDKNTENLISAAQTHYKDKKPVGAGAAIKDSYNAQIEIIQNAQALVERNTKLSVDKINSEHKRGMVNDLDYINQVAEAEKASITKSIEAFKGQQRIASQKKDSRKEVQKFEGDIEKAKDALHKRELDRGFAVMELNEKVGRQKLDSLLEELAAISDLNKSYAKQKETGLLDNADRKFELDFREKLVGVSDKQKEEMTLMFEEESRLRKINRKEIEDLKKAQEDYNQAVLNNPNLKEEANRQLGITTTGVKTVSAGARDNSTRETDIKVQEINIKINGLDQIASAFDSLGTIVGNFGNTAQTNLDNITSSIAKMGSSYKGQFNGMLKEAQASAAGYGRLQKSIGGISGALKTLSAAEKAGKEGSSERMQAQVTGYGEMAGAAAEYFEKGSTGYDLLKTAEQAFYLAKFAMQVQAMVMDKTMTGESVINSGLRAAADGVAAFAKTLASLPFPFNLAAGAVVIGALVAAGVAMSGGGGSSSTFGTAGPGNQIGTDGRRVSSTPRGVDAPDNYSEVDGTISLRKQTQLSDSEVKARADAAAIDAAANAVSNLRIESMKLTKGSEELEKSLARARVAAGGAGAAQHDLATQGMNEAELASYNYNQALLGQLSAQMDIANGTEHTSDNMKKLAEESRSLAIELAMASGDIAGARAMQRQDDTAGYTAQEVAMYDHNAAVRSQVEAATAGAAAAREVAQAEEELANKRYELTGRLNILLGRQTQLEYDRITELAGTTDAASLGMLNLIYMMEDLTAAVDTQYATLERSVAAQEKVIAAERKLVEARLASATALQAALKSAKDATTLTMSRSKAQEGFSSLLALAKATGVLPSLETLKPLLDSLTANSENLFGTFEDYQRDFLRTAYDIKEMSTLADNQVSIEQESLNRLDAQVEAMKLQLETAKAQLDALKGIDTSVNNVAKAIEDFDNAMRALSGAKSSAATYAASAPMASSGSSGGGGYSGGGTSGGAASAFEDIAGQENKDIVAAYRAYYNRNPDPSGYKYFLDSLLTGDKLMQSILGASAGNPEGGDFKTAVSRGYNPLDPLTKFLKSTTTGAAPISTEDFGSFAIGSNFIPNDQIAQIHKGERILPAADNRELFARLQSPDDNARVLSQAVRDLKEELVQLRKASDRGNENTKSIADTLQGNQGVPFLVEIAQ